MLRTLEEDGVDLERFYPCIYETSASTGGWLRCEAVTMQPLMTGMQSPMPPWRDGLTSSCSHAMWAQIWRQMRRSRP